MQLKNENLQNIFCPIFLAGRRALWYNAVVAIWQKQERICKK